MIVYKKLILFFITIFCFMNFKAYNETLIKDVDLIAINKDISLLKSKISKNLYEYYPIDKDQKYELSNSDYIEIELYRSEKDIENLYKLKAKKNVFKENNSLKNHENLSSYISFSNLNSKLLKFEKNRFFWSLGLEIIKNEHQKLYSGEAKEISIGIRNNFQRWKGKNTFETGLKLHNSKIIYHNNEKHSFMTNSLYTNYSNAYLINKVWSVGYGMSGYLINILGDDFMEENIKRYNLSLDTKITRKLDKRTFLSLGLNYSKNYTLGFHGLNLNKQKINLFTKPSGQISFSLITILNKENFKLNNKNNISELYFNNFPEKKIEIELSEDKSHKRKEKNDSKSLKEFALSFSRDFDKNLESIIF